MTFGCDVSGGTSELSSLARGRLIFIRIKYRRSHMNMDEEIFLLKTFIVYDFYGPLLDSININFNFNFTREAYTSGG